MPSPEKVQIDIVVPVLGDDVALQELVETAPLATVDTRWWVVDGQSSATTQLLCEKLNCHYLASQAGRGHQIALGISRGDAPVVWVLHADTRFEENAVHALIECANRQQPFWGRFDVYAPALQLIARLMNFRSRRSKICTGDQAMFFSRDLLDSVGGFPQQALMEDIEVSKRLKKLHAKKFVACAVPVRMNIRRWQRYGVARTVMLMWFYRFAYFCGVEASRLYRWYYGSEAKVLLGGSEQRCSSSGSATER